MVHQMLQLEVNLLLFAAPTIRASTVNHAY